MNNIYVLLNEYRQQKDEKEKKLFIMALELSTRRSLKNLIALQDDSSRFENMYDSWISTTQEEMVLLEVYSFVIEVVDNLNQYCVSKEVKKEFDTQQKSMIKLLLKYKRFYEVAQLLQIRMEDERFKDQKMVELKDIVQNYLKEHEFKTPDKFNEQIFKWVATRHFPPYILFGYNENLVFSMDVEMIDSNILAVKIAKAIEKKPRNITKYVNELIKYRDIKSI